MELLKQPVEEVDNWTSITNEKKMCKAWTCLNAECTTQSLFHLYVTKIIQIDFPPALLRYNWQIKIVGTWGVQYDIWYNTHIQIDFITIIPQMRKQVQE